MKFSERIGKTEVRSSLQVESMDQRLANKLWNAFLKTFLDLLDSRSGNRREITQENVILHIWTEYYGNQIDEIPRFYNNQLDVDSCKKYIKEQFFRGAWYEKYDFVEFIASLDVLEAALIFADQCNRVLAAESAGYRIIKANVVQITSEEEIQAIEEAIQSPGTDSVRTHLKTALSYLSNREKVDYRNSVKESISAVESYCVSIVGEGVDTLGQALKMLEKEHGLHKALKNAFSSLYGYTSDAGGIRHSLLDDKIAVTMEDAKFMLVSCSAFINYLKSTLKS